MLDHFKDMNKMQEVLREAQTGLWVIEIGEGEEPRMYGDSSMLRLLGLETMPSPEECYKVWYGNIDPDYYPVVQSAVENIISANRAEVRYSWNHPKWGKIYVRCGGVLDSNYKKGVCLRGYHQNITDTIMLQQEYDSVVKTLSENYNGIILWNLRDGTFNVMKAQAVLQELLEKYKDYENFIREYAFLEAEEEYRELVQELADPAMIMERIRQGEWQTERLYRNKSGHWRRLKIVRAAQYSEINPWVIIAFDDQDLEVEKKLDAAAAQAAVSRIYRLVISVDLKKGEYNCLHYSGDLLKLSGHGKLEDYLEQMLSRMPSEDRKNFARIYEEESYQDNEYLDGIIRIRGLKGHLHYYNYYAARIQETMGERILLTVRNIDDKKKERQKADILSNLCQGYYSIYLFDIENDVEEAVWQEDMIRRNHEFPKGSLNYFYEKFVINYVAKEDQEKMRLAGNPDFLRKTLTPEQPVYEIDFRRVYPDGLQWVRSRFSIGEITDGVVTKVIFANMNIHEQKIKEMEEEQKKRLALISAYETAKAANEAKSSFLAQMSHDIRTPMNAIMGMASIASSHCEEPKRVQECLEKIQLSGRHLLALINDILDMSKIEKGRVELLKEPFQLEALLGQVDTIIRSGAEAKELKFQVKWDGVRHKSLIGDEAHIRQVLINLLGNAVKYTDHGGHIRLTVQELFGRSGEEACFVFTVEDDGIGMPEDFISCIFAPFTRGDNAAHIQGTGLGMPIAKGIVDAMKGDIRVESRLGHGTRITVTLNLKLQLEELEEGVTKGAKTPGEREGEAEGKKLAGRRILLVEDNELNREIAGTLLREAGMLVDEAYNGLAAAERFEEAAPGTYAAVFMDLQMPVMDGYEAARRIRKSGRPQAKSIPIIALTANAFAEDVANVLAAGMNDHVSKPVDLGQLLEALKKNIKD